MISIKDIKQNYAIEEVIGKRIHLKRQGTQWVGNCIFHNDDHASLKVSPSKNIWKCFPCDKSGDMIDFFTLQGKSIPEAINMITNGSVSTPEPRIVKPSNKWINAVPDQKRLPSIETLKHTKYDTIPTRADAYHDANGNVIGFACRFDLPEGKKDVLPYFFKQQIDPDGNPLGNAIWRWSEPDKPRVLYNLHLLNQRPADTVLVVEGEKTADAASLLFPQYVCVSWMGGADNVRHADWSVLAGRNIYMWPDNDIAGIHCMFGGWQKNEVTGDYKRVTGITELVKANFKRINNEPKFPKKWDVADADWTPEQAMEYLLSHRGDLPTVLEYPPNESAPEPVAVELPPAPPKPEPIPKTPKTETVNEHTPKNPYFKCLGFENHDQNLYVFFVYRTNVIVKLSAGGISVSNLLQLAPLNYWEGAFPKPTKSSGVKFEINTIADFLINLCCKAGIFNPNNIRGRGAWIDNGVPVMHCGDTLIVDGKYTKFEKHKSKFIYEAGQELGFNLVKPLEKHHAYNLLTLLERLNWGRKIDARLIAGWIVIAPMCGALNWRSHLWLTGASGSGKSEIMKLFIKRFLGQMFVNAQGATTEAGIRQYLKADALPVVFDEAESEDKKSADRMQSVLEIMRASSTSDGGKIFKGSAGGSAAQFDIRSCFAFASIGANLTQRSDISRITVLEIKKDESDDHKEKWQDTLKIYSDTVTDEFVRAFQSRTVNMLPTILKNAQTFSNAAAAVLDSNRTGDQLGALLAGAYSLASDNEISFDDAKKWVKEREWEQERLAESTRDEVKVINKIMDAEARVETTEGPRTRTVGELIMQSIGTGDPMDYMLNKELANMTLRRLGIKTENKWVIFSDTSDFIARSLVNTAYAKNFHTILSRVDGAVKMDSTTFASGIKSRAVKIESSIIFQETGIEIEKKQEIVKQDIETERDLFGSR